MADFEMHNLDRAPEGSKTALEGVKKKAGFVPNIYQYMAAAPAVVNSYAGMQEQLGKSSLSPKEQHVIFMTASSLNGCRYCMAAHTTTAKGIKMPEETIQHLRSIEPLEDPKLEALRKYTRALVEKRGQVSEEEVDAFLEAGYTEQQALEVLVGVAMKTITNYLNAIVKTPVDQQFQPEAWTPPAA
jgi:uncharacterized peroxidase-related enzyme